MIVAWVIGSGGLLGAALSRTVRGDGVGLFTCPERLCWDSESELARQLAAYVKEFAAQMDTGDQWEIYWAAGVGIMSSSEEELAPETRMISLLLHLIETEKRLITAHGAIVFASSAGAIYAGSFDEIIDEDSLPAPTTAYAREKLKQEELIGSFAARNTGKRALLARITTLYGTSKAVQKRQGLLAHIARSILRNQPVQIYVPFDTIRDYISADDAAAAMVVAIRAPGEQPRASIKIVASEQPATIAEIVSIFKRIVRRGPRVITSASRLSALYTRRVQFRSVVLQAHARAPVRSLTVGIAQLIAAERAAFVRCSVSGSERHPT